MLAMVISTTSITTDGDGAEVISVAAVLLMMNITSVGGQRVEEAAFGSDYSYDMSRVALKEAIVMIGPR